MSIDATVVGLSSKSWSAGLVVLSSARSANQKESPSCSQVFQLRSVPGRSTVRPAVALPLQEAARLIRDLAELPVEPFGIGYLVSFLNLLSKDTDPVRLARGTIHRLAIDKQFHP